VQRTLFKPINHFHQAIFPVNKNPSALTINAAEITHFWGFDKRRFPYTIEGHTKNAPMTDDRASIMGD
jgi:hypothetical protein